VTLPEIAGLFGASPRPAPRLRYVVDLPAGDSARPLVQMALCAVREAAKAAPAGGSLRAALTMLAGGRVEEVPR